MLILFLIQSFRLGVKLRSCFCSRNILISRNSDVFVRIHMENKMQSWFDFWLCKSWQLGPMGCVPAPCSTLLFNPDLFWAAWPRRYPPTSCLWLCRTGRGAAVPSGGAGGSVPAGRSTWRPTVGAGPAVLLSRTHSLLLGCNHACLTEWINSPSMSGFVLTRKELEKRRWLQAEKVILWLQALRYDHTGSHIVFNGF